MESDFKNLRVATDVIIEIGSSIVLVERAEPPFGWSFPGGFVEYGESFEDCAIREALEEVGLAIKLKEQFHTYSDPRRDPRYHTISTVFIAIAHGVPIASEESISVGLFNRNNLPYPVVFDHDHILIDYFNYIDGMEKEEIFKKYL